MLEVIVVGGGPAGMSAALCLGRSRRTTLLVDAGEGRNSPAAAVHNLLGHDGTPPAELRRVGRAELSRYPTVRCTAAAVKTATKEADGTFRVVLGDGDVVRSRWLVLATGLVDDLPAIDGVAPLWGRSAFHCPYCHGFEASGQRIAVVGGEPARAWLALHLSRFSPDVVLCTDGPHQLPAALTSALETAGVRIAAEPIARLEADGDRLEAVVLVSGAPLPRDAVFIATTLQQRADLAARLGCALLPDGCVEVDELGRTSVAGVSAAGDMARRRTVPVPLAAVVAAAASGTIAATCVDQDLIGVDAGLPSPFARWEGLDR